MELASLWFKDNSVIIRVTGKADIIFKEKSREQAVKRYTAMKDILPTLIEEVVLSGAFEPMDEKDIL